MKVLSCLSLALLISTAFSLTIRGNDQEEEFVVEEQENPDQEEEELIVLEQENPPHIPNEFRTGCSDAAGSKISLRPVGQRSVTTAVYARCANPFHPVPLNYIVGTNDPDCGLDVVESCDTRMSDNSVTCDVTVAPLNLQGGTCDFVAVTATIHVLCCG